MTYKDACEFLSGLGEFRIKLGLERIHAILAAVGNPQNAYPTIHVAGTNGKGSVTHFAAAGLAANGLRVGRYTSPHLHELNERIAINNRNISDDAFCSLFNEIKAVADAQAVPLTYFEWVTLIAFLYFAREKVDAAVIEVGLGGRLDATNVITPAVAVITSIGLDHQDYLGDTLLAIAGEKAGILKAGVPVISGVEQSDVAEFLCERAKALGCRVVQLEIDAIAHLPSLSLPGSCARRNATLALEAVRASGLNHNRELAVQAIAATTIPGRAEWYTHPRPTLLDGAHNPAAFTSLAEIFAPHVKEGKPWALIFGAMANKDYREMLAVLSQRLPPPKQVLLVQLPEGRAARVEDLLAAVPESWPRGSMFMSPSAALDKAEALTLIAGSFYLAGACRPLLQRSIAC